MASRAWSAFKVVAVAGLTVYAVSIFAGDKETATVAANTVQGTAWGAGVLGGSAKQVGPGFRQGMADAGGTAPNALAGNP